MKDPFNDVYGMGIITSEAYHVLLTALIGRRGRNYSQKAQACQYTPIPIDDKPL